jgi:hypothetical protein
MIEWRMTRKYFKTWRFIMGRVRGASGAPEVSDSVRPDDSETGECAPNLLTDRSR